MENQPQLHSNLVCGGLVQQSSQGNVFLVKSVDEKQQVDTDIGQDNMQILKQVSLNLLINQVFSTLRTS